MNRPDDVTLVQRSMEFCVWYAARRGMVSVGEVMKVFRCSRATAFRWMRAYKDARATVARGLVAANDGAPPCARGSA